MKENDGLVEGLPEIYMRSCKNLIPGNAEKIGNTRSYEFYMFSDDNNGEMQFGIRINSYHPGELTISRSKMQELLLELEKKS